MKSMVTLLLLLTALFSGASGPAGGEKADKVVVYKSKRQMQMLRAGKVLRTYRIALGDSPVGHKKQEGDEKTPEGAYVLDWRNPNSIYYKSIHISYPNAQDREQARRHHDPRQERAGGTPRRHPEMEGLDRRLYCREQCRNGRNLGAGQKWHAHPDPSVNCF
jgi:hypothetical protein